jgi:hypothetical protein
MLINPNLPDSQRVLRPIPGTRIVQETLGLIGVQLLDPYNPLRIWTIQGLYSPVAGRALGGLRAKLEDQKGFITFINQRDLEVLLEVERPGNYCVWLSTNYVGIQDRDWYGFCVDTDDLLDDLYDRELQIRAQYPRGAILPSGIELTRRIHNGYGDDYEELYTMLWDMDPGTGYGPDDRFETLESRWRSVERTPSRLRGRLWNTI